MAFPEKTSQPVVSTKPLADDCKLDEFRKHKTVRRKYPPPKIRIGAKAVRDFPPRCGILHFKMVNSQPFEDSKLNSIKPEGLGFKTPSFGSKASGKVKFWDPREQVVRDFPPVSRIIQERKPLENLDNVDSKSIESHPFEKSKLKFFKPKELAVNNKPFGSRPTRKVKYWGPISSNDDNAQESKVTNTINTIGSINEKIRREKIREVMILFDTVYTQLFQENASKHKGEKIANWRLPTKAARIVKQKLKWMNADKALGQINSVQPGDIFRFRSQLHLVGLHCQPHCGIDYTNINGKNVAISIVDSHRYSNESQSCDVLTYCGEGGNGVGSFGSKQQVSPDDQKLERGNLALKNSMIEKNLVRVIRKVFGIGKKKNNVFVYDGLYTVKHCTQKRSLEGKMVFMFDLHKMPGQPHFQKWVNVIAGDILYHHSTFQML